MFELAWNIDIQSITVSDINDELINVYNIVKNDIDNLVIALQDEPITLERFLEIRSIDRVEWWKENYSPLERAVRFIYLNRTCFNWLYRLNKSWEFNVPFNRHTKENVLLLQEERLRLASQFLNDNNITILNQSYEAILNSVEEWDFVYLDPPYDNFAKSYNAESFWDKKQAELRGFCDELNKRWTLFAFSNHNTDLINELYEKYNKHILLSKRRINSVASKRWNVEEVLYTNYET